MNSEINGLIYKCISFVYKKQHIIFDENNMLAFNKTEIDTENFISKKYYDDFSKPKKVFIKNNYGEDQLIHSIPLQTDSINAGYIMVLDDSNNMNDITELKGLIKDVLQFVDDIKDTKKELKWMILSSDGIAIHVNRKGGIEYCNEITNKILKYQESVIQTYVDCLIENTEKHDIPSNSSESYYSSILYVDEDDRKNSGMVILVKDIFDSMKKTRMYSKMIRDFSFSAIIGKSPSIINIIQMAKKIAPSESTVLITGESGTGKEMFARAIHNASARKSEPFVPVNCAAIPDNLLESELFGYEGGSFTGALKSGKAGKFEQAGNGTIFLDEIGDMPLNLQAKLLRVLQEKKVERIGGTTQIPVNVRIISATNKELHREVETGDFREDLFYRLSVVPLRIPALRERRSDILNITRYYLLLYCLEFSYEIKSLSSDVEGLFLKYTWPGNIRELKNVIEYASVMSSHEIINVDCLPARFQDSSHREKNLFLGTTDIQEIKKISELEKDEIIKALKLFGNDRQGIEKAYKALGFSKSTLYRKFKQYGIDLNKY